MTVSNPNDADARGRRSAIIRFIVATLFAVGLVAAVLRAVFAPKQDAFDPVLSLLAKQRSFSIVQVGAYVGDTPNDPLFPFLRRQLTTNNGGVDKNTKVVLVEPIREYFDALRKNYEYSPAIRFENVAVAETEGPREMYRLKVDPVEHGYPAWLSQLSSLKKERLEEIWDKYEQNPEFKKFYLENRIVEVVQCTPLRNLLKKHDIKQLDLLQVDAEGYDFEILKTLDFETVQPRFINYERVLLHDEEAACRRMLSERGYILIDWDKNTLAVREDSYEVYRAETYRWYDPAAWRAAVLGHPGAAIVLCLAAIFGILFRRRFVRWARRSTFCGFLRSPRRERRRQRDS